MSLPKGKPAPLHQVFYSDEERSRSKEIFKELDEVESPREGLVNNLTKQLLDLPEGDCGGPAQGRLRNMQDLTKLADASAEPASSREESGRMYS